MVSKLMPSTEPIKIRILSALAVIKGIRTLDSAVELLTTWPVLVAALVALYGLSYAIDGFDFSNWDHMGMTGFTFVIIGLWISKNLGKRVASTFQRLEDRQVLRPATGVIMSKVEGEMSKLAVKWAIAINVLVVTSFVLGLSVHSSSPLSIFLWAVTGLTVGYIVSHNVGKIVAYGFLYRYLEPKYACLHIEPGHIDRACGLKPLGDFYMFQAVLLAIPAIHLFSWSLLIPNWEYQDYMMWKEIYLFLSVITIVLFYPAVAKPLFFLHATMKAKKEELLRDADKTSPEIQAVRERLREAQSEDERTAISGELLLKTDYYHQIENMPTWPFNMKALGRFGLQLPIGLVGPAVGISTNFVADFLNL